MKLAETHVKKFLFYAALILFTFVCYRVFAPKWVIDFPHKYNRFTGELYEYQSPYENSGKTASWELMVKRK